MKTNYSNATMLDMVFENRNKAFGAYVLRRDYNQEILRALLITVSSVFILCFANFIKEHLKSTIAAIPKVIIATPRDPVVMAKKEVKPPAPPKTPEARAPRQTSRDPEMQVVAQAQAPDSVPENKSITSDAGMGTSGPANSNTLGTEGGRGKLIGEPAAELIKGPSAPILIAEIMPEYPGGEKALMRFLADNTEYPSMYRENGISGRVVTQFTVNEDGSISDIAVVKSPGPQFDKEVTRVIKILRPFKPGMQQGKPVRVRYVLPFNFKTND